MRRVLSIVLVAAPGAPPAAFDRARCAAPGKYVTRNQTDLLARAFDGPSFFDGRWRGDRFEVEPPCELRAGDAFACAAVGKLVNRRSRVQPSSASTTVQKRPRILVVGDSISVRQFRDFAGRVKACATTTFVRADRLREKEFDGAARAEACGMDALLLNTGAHYPDVREFAKDVREFLRLLNVTCGPRTPVTVFRTTPEGNPLCNAKMTVRNAGDWESKVWSVLNGSQPVPSDEPQFSRGWHWHLFQRYNAEAARLVQPYDWITIADVVPMARLVQGRYDRRPGKALDCLHGSPAVPIYNALILNVLDAVL